MIIAINDDDNNNDLGSEVSFDLDTQLAEIKTIERHN
jgi:hypothetical protein